MSSLVMAHGRHHSISGSTAAINAMLDRLDEAQPLASADVLGKRFRYRVPGMQVDILRNESILIQWSAPTRWLSANGVSFVCDRYVRPDLDCRVTLISLYGTWDTVTGFVARCQQVDPGTFEIEVGFRRSIDPAIFVADAIRWKGLLVEDDELTARMITRTLESANISVEHVTDGSAALEKMTQGGYDLVLLDYELPQVSGAEIAKQARAAGYPGVIVGVSAYNSPQIRDACLNGGCSAFLAKPFGQPELTNLLAALRNEPIYTSLTFADDALPLLLEYVEALPKDAARLQQAFEQGDAAAAEAELRTLCSRSSAFGFIEITSAALAIDKAMKEGAPLDQLRGRVSELARQCYRARVAGNARN